MLLLLRRSQLRPRACQLPLQLLHPRAQRLSLRRRRAQPLQLLAQRRCIAGRASGGALGVAAQPRLAFDQLPHPQLRGLQVARGRLQPLLALLHLGAALGIPRLKALNHVVLPFGGG